MEIIPQTKICTICKTKKCVTMFSKNSGLKDGFQPRCKACRAKDYADNKSKITKQTKKYYKDNKEKINKKAKEYYGNNKEKFVETNKQYRESHKEEMIEYKKRYYLDNKKEILLKDRKYYKENTEKILQRNKKYRDAHKEEISISKKQWAITEKGRMCDINSKHKRRMAKSNKNNNTIPMSIEFPLTNSLHKMLISQNHSCKYCGCDIKQGNMHLDHIVPLSKGGVHSISNVQWLCRTCNLRKGCKLESDFLTNDKKESYE